MQIDRKWIQFQTLDAQPIQIGDVALTMQSRILAVRLPFAGYVWNRPVGIVVRDGAAEFRVPITDVTRAATWSLYLLSVFAGVLIWLNRPRDNR